MVFAARRRVKSLTLLPITTLLLLSLSTSQSLAFSEEVMDTFLDSGVTSLTRGGLVRLPRQPETLDFDSPLFLDSNRSHRVETGYEGQLTAKVYDGRWKGSAADSEKLHTAVAAPFSLLGDKVEGSVAAGYGFTGFELRAVNEREETYVHTKQRFESKKGGIYLNAFQRISLGASIIDTQYRESVQTPVQLEVALAKWLKGGYRHAYSNFATTMDLRLLGHEGNLPMRSIESRDELYLVLDYSPVRAKLVQELSYGKNRRAEAKLELPASWYLVGEYDRRDFADIDQDFTVDGIPSGYVRGNLQKKMLRAGVGTRLSSRWSLEANYRHSDISFDGGGVASPLAVAGFWPSLIVGNYNYMTSASISADQYHVAGEFQGDNLSFGIGMQYIDLKPAAQVSYWRNTILGLGNSDADIKKLHVRRIGMIFLGTGIGYKWKNVEAKYALGQFIPVSVTEDDPDEPVPPDAPDDDRSVLSQIAEKIRHYPGGGLHRLLITVTF